MIVGIIFLLVLLLVGQAIGWTAYNQIKDFDCVNDLDQTSFENSEECDENRLLGMSNLETVNYIFIALTILSLLLLIGSILIRTKDSKSDSDEFPGRTYPKGFEP